MRILDAETWQELGQSLARHRVRTVLTAAGVFWGMFMLVVLLGFGRGLQAGVTKSFSEFTAKTIWVWPERTTMAHRGRAPGRSLSIRLDDLAALEENLVGVAALSPHNEIPGGMAEVRHGTRHARIAVRGDDHDIARMQVMAIDQGRFMSPTDVAEARKVAFLGAQVFAQLFPRAQTAVGKSIVIGGVDFTVAGVFHLEGGGDEQRNNRIVLPWTTVARTFGPRDRVNSVAILPAPDADPIALEHQACALLARRHQVHPHDRMAFNAWSAYANARKIESLFAGVEILLWVVGGFTLFAGALGVGNVMLVSVRERTAEIGLRKALGATPAHVVGQVVLEAVTLTSFAGYLGLFFGVLFVDGAAGFIRSLPPAERPTMLEPPHVDFVTAIVGLSVLFLAGLVSSYLPARAAAAIDPAIALQTE